MLLIVGEAIVAYRRDPQAAPSGPWLSGSPALTACAAGRLEVPTTFVGGIGNDEHGRVLADELAANGVRTDHLVVAAEAPTATAYVTRHGPNRQFDFRVAGTAATLVTERDLGDLPERADWLHLSGSALTFGEPLAETTLSALRRARSAGARISIDPNVRPAALDRPARSSLIEMFGLAHVLLPGEGELAALGVDAFALVAAGATVCTTLGAGGATVTDGAGTTHVDAVPVDAADADGAGDAFAAGFIAAALAGGDPVAAARAGVRVAAAALGTPGAPGVRVAG
jgi:sugar/nucleoside kinase (ribokinase family)